MRLERRSLDLICIGRTCVNVRKNVRKNLYASLVIADTCSASLRSGSPQKAEKLESPGSMLAKVRR